MKKLGFIILTAVVFIIGVAVGNLFFQKPPLPENKCLEKYSYINPLLGCGVKFYIKKHGYADLKSRLQAFISSKKSEGKISQASVYYRDLANGPWLGIDEHDEFSPASLLKLPIMFAYLRIAEDDDTLLKKKLTITSLPQDEEKQFFKPEKTLNKGETYTVEELIRRMIAYSDNRASNVLVEYLFEISKSDDLITTTLKETGTLQSEASPGDVVSVKAYASLFRLLYNPAYLSQDLSEKALQILSEAKFKDGIVDGLPDNIRVSHKFGERVDKDKGFNQLHDCGIVYFPDNPYLLCVMTKGKDFRELSEIIQEISRMVYEEIDSRRI